MDAAFSDDEPIGASALPHNCRQFLRCRKPYRKIAQVAVVYADDARACCQRAIQFVLVMHLDQRCQMQMFGQRTISLELRIVENRHD